MYPPSKILFLAGVDLGKYNLPRCNKSSYFPTNHAIKVLSLINTDLAYFEKYIYTCILVLQNTSKNDKCYYAYKRFHVISMVSKLTLYNSSLYSTIITEGFIGDIIQRTRIPTEIPFTENIDDVLLVTPAITKHCTNDEYISNDYTFKCTCQ